MKEGREGFDFLTDSVEEEEIWRRNERECGGKGGSIEERVHFWGTRRAVSNNLTPFSLRIATSSRLGLPAIKRASRLRLPNISVSRAFFEIGTRIGKKKGGRNGRGERMEKTMIGWETRRFEKRVNALKRIHCPKKKRSAYRLEIVRGDKFKNSTHRTSKRYFFFFFSKEKKKITRKYRVTNTNTNESIGTIEINNMWCRWRC